MTRLARVVTVGLGLVACAPLSARAQAMADPAPGRVEVGIGWTWIGRETIAGGDATETTSSRGSLALFRTSTQLAAGNGLVGRIGIKLTPAFELEAAGTYAVPQLRTQISGDFETAVPVTAVETVHHFTVGTGLLWYVRRHQARPARVAPFLMAGGGYLHEAYAGLVLVETGRFYEVGGGVKFLVARRDATFLKGVGLRVDARALTRRGGVAFDGRSHLSPKLGAAVFMRF